MVVVFYIYLVFIICCVMRHSPFLVNRAWFRKGLQANFLCIIVIGQTERKSSGKDRNRPSAQYLARHRKLPKNGSNYHNKSAFISLDKFFLIFLRKRTPCGCLYSAHIQCMFKQTYRDRYIHKNSFLYVNYLSHITSVTSALIRLV